ncbi:hypothetical protein BJX63DRAFT_400471 [Aspergillus granulosus]|uniref:Uncharacterized protein n=1 Tax=Aspergillus granulosus TaxID=176169 RepID=A0ABR4H651_9EURO
MGWVTGWISDRLGLWQVLIEFNLAEWSTLCNAGMAPVWDMVEENHQLFAKRIGILDDEKHIMKVVALIGPLSLESFQWNGNCR